jgi:hypothetical protein
MTKLSSETPKSPGKLPIVESNEGQKFWLDRNDLDALVERSKRILWKTEHICHGLACWSTTALWSRCKSVSTGRPAAGLGKELGDE